MNDATSWGKVWLVGAGPGDPELITVKGKRCVESADVILYDELVNTELLACASETCDLRYVGKRAGAHGSDQRAIEAELIRLARSGKNVVRLKGGDPFVFGRGGEEAQALRKAGISFEIVPGISSALAVAAYAGIPVTHRACSSSVALITGHKVDKTEIKWRDLARSVDTLVILMGLRNIEKITGALLTHGCDPLRPAALIQSGTLAEQKSCIGNVSTVAALARAEKFRSPTIIVIGDVVGFAPQLQWFDGQRSAMPSRVLSETLSEALPTDWAVA